MNLLTITRIFLGIIFIWYGTLKFFSGVSPAEGLAIATIDKLFFSLIPPTVSIILLAIWELIIGIGFLVGRYLKYVSILYLVHITLTFTPLILLPELCFTNPPFEFTIVGQYIGKNLIFFMVGLMIYQQNKSKT
ncbi:DoxX family membrane protein [Sulfurimonas sp.]|uniref:DoxX family membrane protein n=1 Tax=Sulfurimonas sp. TaxID=2022749 RepID=UPI003D0AD586